MFPWLAPRSGGGGYRRVVAPGEPKLALGTVPYCCRSELLQRARMVHLSFSKVDSVGNVRVKRVLHAYG